MTLKLRKYQRKTIRRMVKFKGRALLALDMGLGKTACTLAWLLRHDTGPAVIVCPASVKWQWQDEAWEHFGLTSIVCTGRTPPSAKGFHQDYDLFIVNFDILHWWLPWIKKHFPAQTVVIDECQYCKNKSAKRTKAVIQLCKKKPHVLALSGTPVTNRPVELYPILNILRPSRYGSFVSYTEQFCKRRWTRWGWNYRGAKNLDRLHEQLKRDCMIRLRKKDVLKELPDKERHVVPLDIICRLDYIKAERDLSAWLSTISRTKARKAKKAEQISKLMVLRQLAAELKLKYVFDWIDNFFESSSEKLVVYAWHKKIIRKLAEKYPDCAVITGSTPAQERRQQVQKFIDNKKCRLFAGNIQAAGTGINGLQKAASHAAFIELPWNPALLMQAEDRLHRIGQHNAVQIHLLIARDTVEHDLVKLLQAKQGILDQILDGKTVTDLDVFDKLIRSLQKR